MDVSADFLVAYVGCRFVGVKKTNKLAPLHVSLKCIGDGQNLNPFLLLNLQEEQRMANAMERSPIERGKIRGGKNLKVLDLVIKDES